MLRWNAPIYAFYDPMPAIKYLNGRKCHTFKCGAQGCCQVVQCYIGTADAQSIGILRKHVKKCWGEDVLRAANGAKDHIEACEKVVSGYLKNGSFTVAFGRRGKGKVSYSHQQHTRAETKAEIVCWVAESLRPFQIVADRGFQNLMKTGRPGCYLPSPTTVAHDVKLVFSWVRVNDSQECDGGLSFSTDAWTSPNHWEYVAIMVHFEQEGVPFTILLDIVEVAEVCTYQ
ncbi:hypothetical protein K439DRAFT_1340015 [Ramaria rubella]|nr:hypothetical protein K439DRAFT_1340015 [Ramaria rubella]